MAEVQAGSEPHSSNEPELKDEGEGLLSASRVQLIGRRFTGLKLTSNVGLSLNSTGALYAAIKRHAEVAASKGAMTDSELDLARIYGYFYLGTYYECLDLPVMLVFPPAKALDRETSGKVASGLGLQGVLGDFTIWEADSLDAAVRIDISVGWLSELLVSRGSATSVGAQLVAEGGETDGEPEKQGNIFHARRRRMMSGTNIFTRRP